MVQCELCGSETAAPKSIKVEGAKLDVCDNCANLGTQVDQTPSESTSTKYSTGAPGQSSSPSKSTTPSRSGRQTRSRGDDDMFDSLGELAQDYDDIIREAREDRGLSQTELARELNEKRSLIRKLERGEILPNDSIQAKLERYLEIDLTGGTVDAVDWSADDDGQSFTLGELAERKD